MVTFTAAGNPVGQGATDQLGGDILTLLRQAAQTVRETTDLSKTLAAELKCAQERVKQLKQDLEQSRDRLAQTEGWLFRIQMEMEEAYSDLATEELQRVSQRVP